MQVYQFTVVIEADENAFHAYVPALPGCHTFGDTVEEARQTSKKQLPCTLNACRRTANPFRWNANPCLSRGFLYLWQYEPKTTKRQLPTIDPRPKACGL